MQCMETDKLKLAVALTRIDFLSAGAKLQLFKKLDNFEELALLSIEELSKYCKKPVSKTKWNPKKLQCLADNDLHLMEQYKINLVTIAEPDFPPLLKEISQAPFALYYRGNISVLHKSCVGVVGTRHPDSQGLKAAFNISKELACNNVTVVSGLALGVDAAAHKGALDSETGSTAAFLASGVDVISPTSNKPVAARILRNGGCILSEYPLQSEAISWHFPERNRLISGVSASVIVIEALEKSGALITAEFALEQNRELFIHPVALDYHDFMYKSKSVENETLSGVQKYIQDGATVTEDVQQIIETGKYINVNNEFTF